MLREHHVEGRESNILLAVPTFLWKYIKCIDGTRLATQDEIEI